jgi:hypothetical protein
MTTVHLDANKLWCRVRCFGLPLYSANAREALAERLGLLLLSASAFGGKADMDFLAVRTCMKSQLVGADHRALKSAIACSGGWPHQR